MNLVTHSIGFVKSSLYMLSLQPRVHALIITKCHGAAAKRVNREKLEGRVGFGMNAIFLI